MIVKTIYLNNRWSEIQQSRTGEKSDQFIYSDCYGKVEYRFLKLHSGTIGGVDYFDLIPAVSAGGSSFVVEGDDKPALVKSFVKVFDEYCMRNKIVSEFVIFDPWNPLQDLFSSYYCINKHGRRYCVNLDDDYYFKTQFSYARRKAVNKSKRFGCTSELVSFEAGASRFIELYHFTELKHNASQYYRLTMQQLNEYHSIFGSNMLFINIVFQEKVICSVMLVKGEDVCHGLFIGCVPEYNYLCPTALYEFEACRYAKSQGCHVFDWGSAQPGSGVERHKLGCCSSDNILTCYVGKRVCNNHIYNELIAANGKSAEGRFPEFLRK